ncbi:MAG: dihydrofolate reductase [Eubacteriales bacterium]|nr:dihydrofolate reductase [Eubacteriales bacterium]
MNVSMIVAMSENRVIGSNNAMPWYLPEDLKKFRELTTGHAILMGRKTFESLPKVLPGREHYVVTGNSDYKETNERASGSEHVFTAPDPVAALDLIADRITTSGDIPDEVFVIGGGELFEQLLPYTERVYVTLIRKEMSGDTFFPELSLEDWVQTSSEEFDGFDFLIYDRSTSIC